MVVHEHFSSQLSLYKSTLTERKKEQKKERKKERRETEKDKLKIDHITWTEQGPFIKLDRDIWHKS